MDKAFIFFGNEKTKYVDVWDRISEGAESVIFFFSKPVISTYHPNNTQQKELVSTESSNRTNLTNETGWGIQRRTYSYKRSCLPGRNLEMKFGLECGGVHGIE